MNWIVALNLTIATFCHSSEELCKTLKSKYSEISSSKIQKSTFTLLIPWNRHLSAWLLLERTASAGNAIYLGHGWLQFFRKSSEEMFIWEEDCKHSPLESMVREHFGNWFAWDQGVIAPNFEGLVTTQISVFLPRKVIEISLMHENVRNGSIYIRVMKQHIP